MVSKEVYAKYNDSRYVQPCLYSAIMKISAPRNQSRSAKEDDIDKENHLRSRSAVF